MMVTVRVEGSNKHCLKEKKVDLKRKRKKKLKLHRLVRHFINVDIESTYPNILGVRQKKWRPNNDKLLLPSHTLYPPKSFSSVTTLSQYTSDVNNLLCHNFRTTFDKDVERTVLVLGVLNPPILISRH